jgi:hypothetical protein
MLSERVQALLGISREDLNAMARSRRLLRAITADGVGLFPCLQFDGNRVVPGLAQVLTLFAENQVDGWTLAAWLRTPEPDLGESPLEALRRGEAARVLTVARAAARALGR